MKLVNNPDVYATSSAKFEDLLMGTVDSKSIYWYI